MAVALLLLLGLIAVVVWVILQLSRSTSRVPGTATSARDTLDMRFARGEIDRDDYEERRRLLE